MAYGAAAKNEHNEERGMPVKKYLLFLCKRKH